MPAIPLIFTSGWASGINAYAVVLMLGLLGRFGHMSAVPPTLERTDVAGSPLVVRMSPAVWPELLTDSRVSEPSRLPRLAGYAQPAPASAG
jgi:Domain of unknown function (DUF4126)